jgi:hypothetical protein
MSDAPTRNPTPLDLMLSIESVDTYKRSNCRFYERCLDFAAQRGWQQFHCNHCQAFLKIEDDHADLILARRLLPVIIDGNN